jgi:hypothetical protein
MAEDKNWVRDVCKVGQGAACCRYLALGPLAIGWMCAKHTALKDTLDERVAEGTLKAQGDNCAGRGGALQ